MPLIASRRLLPLLVTQTLGAVNDNLFKNALVVLILFRAAAQSGPALVAAAGGVFILPYVLLSATAGQLSDKYEKSRTILIVKCGELALMALATAGFLLDSTPLLFAVLLGLGIQATFFSPLKIAILPAHLHADELVTGNGLMEAGTFLGILAGTIAGSALIGVDHGAAIVSVTAVAVSLAGIASAALVPPAASSVPDLPVRWNLPRETWRLLGMARANSAVWMCIIGLSWFWAIGATVIAELPTLVRQDLTATAPVFTLMLVFFSVGVAFGSVLCGRLLHGEVSARLVPFAAVLLSLFLWDFGHAVPHARGLATVAAILHSPAGWRMLIDLVLLAAAGGVYSVPLYAIMQQRAEPDRLARMIGANNIMNAAAMASAAGLTAALALRGLSPVAILLWTAVANLLVTVWIVRMLPQDTARAIFRAYFRLCHGVDITGLHNLPRPGIPAVIVVNHQSLLDGCFVATFLPGTPTFAVNRDIAAHWWAKPFLSVVHVVLVDPLKPFGTRAMAQAARAGETLVMFPEGRITTTGALMKVYDGAAMVADKAGAVLVPVRIDGLRYTRLSHMGGGKARRRWFPRLSLTVLPPVAIDVAPDLLGRRRRRAVGDQLQAIMEHAAYATVDTGRTLWSALLDAAGRHGPAMPAIEDTARAPLSYRRVILGACVLGRALSHLAAETDTIALLLPNANATLVTFFALQAWRRTPALLNFSAGADGMLSACATAEVTLVISSRAFIERGRLAAVVARMQEHIRFLWLEDVRDGLGPAARLYGWLDARRPRRLPGACAAPDSRAVVLFTSGSEGTPKGVALSHRNIVANIAQIAAVIDFNGQDRVFNAMPMFHSFGLTGATLLPLFSGVRCFLYPSPLHYRIVPELIYDTDSTIAFATDTFLTGWARFAHPYDFYRMRYIFAGAEKLRDDTRRLYADRFGVRVLEGYGATETSPVLALNTPMHARPGTAGRLLPGIETRLDPVEGIDQGGRLQVRGPNVMLGTLRAAAPGHLDPPPDGWYDTGDICTLDGRFVTITARARRFAKIAGEMVSMPAAEALAIELWPSAAHAVVAIPDARKGEALVLLTTQADATATPLLAAARTRGLPEIAVPRIVRVIDALPMLGTGKIDYPAATKRAADCRPAA